MSTDRPDEPDPAAEPDHAEEDRVDDGPRGAERAGAESAGEQRPADGTDGTTRHLPGGSGPFDDTPDPGPYQPAAGAGYGGDAFSAGEGHAAGSGYGAGSGWGAGGGDPAGAPALTGYLLRHGLSRPTRGRKVCGVCAGLARATGTDPVLWRVLVAIMTLFGGSGLLVYLLGWVLLPADGDEATPIESLLGRGASRTPAVLTVLLSFTAAILGLVILNSDARFTILIAALAAVGALALGRRNQRLGTPATAGAAPPGTGYQTGPTAPAPPPGGAPTQYSVPSTEVQQPAYRAPFAPHGPYRPAGQTPVGAIETSSYGYGPPPPPPPPPRPPRAGRPRERSMLGRFTLLALLLMVAALIALASVGGVGVPADAYIAAALAVVGGGLLVGAWRGRARWLIIPGCVLALCLPVAYNADRVDRDWSAPPPPPTAESHSWQPVTMSGLHRQYRTDIGDAHLDLSGLDFTGQHRAVAVRSDVGDVWVQVPSDVDVVVHVGDGVGDVRVFGRTLSQNERGPNHGSRTVTDLGADGAGPGDLTLNVTAKVGDVEVIR